MQITVKQTFFYKILSLLVSINVVTASVRFEVMTVPIGEDDDDTFMDPKVDVALIEQVDQNSMVQLYLVYSCESLIMPRLRTES